MLSMLKSTPIIFVDDDPDEHETFRAMLDSLKIKAALKCFIACDEAFKYLKTTEDSPSIIFCDINLPKKSGLEFKKDIDDDQQLRKKSIPFVFYTTSAKQKEIQTAYSELNIQGFFEKQNGIEETKNLLMLILQYWYHCKHPNTFSQATTLL